MKPAGARPLSRAATQPPPRATADGNNHARQILIAVGLVLVSLFIYAQTLGFDFVNYDDDQYVFRNAHLKLGLSPAALGWAFTTFFYANWHPLTWLSYLADYQLWGLDPTGYHLTNLLFHCGTVLLVYWVLARMTGAVWRSAFVALLFAVHPLHVESVAWVSERKDVLCAGFGLLALGAYRRYAHSEGHASKRKYYCLVLLFFALGLLSKPMLVTLPFVLLLLDYWPLRRISNYRKLVWEKLPLLAMSAAVSILTVLAQHGGGAVTGFGRMPFSYRASNAAIAYVGYLEKMFWPLELGVLYPLKPALPLWPVLAAAGLLVLLTLLVARQWKRRPYLVVGWLWFLGTLVPVIGLVQVGAQAMADRYAYLPSIGLFVAVVWWISDLVAGSKSLRRAAAAGGAAVVLGLAVGARNQAAFWRDSVTLFEHTLAVTSNNPIIHNNLGFTLARAGKTREALDHYYEALRIDPDYVDAHVNLALALINLGRYPEAIDHYHSALRVNPRQPQVHSNLGVLLFQKGDIPGALASFSEAVRLAPDDAEANNNLGFTLARQGRYAEAVACYTKAIALEPNYGLARTNLEAARRAMILPK
jgi:protein O-mannosyl-transferase